MRIYICLLFFWGYISLTMTARGQEGSEPALPANDKQEISFTIERLEMQQLMIERQIEEVFNSSQNIFLQLQPKNYPVSLSYSNIVEMSDRAYLVGSNGTERSPFMRNTWAEIEIPWQVTDRLVVTPGVYVSNRFYSPMTPSSSTNTGISLDLTYQANEWFTLRGFGRYSIYNNDPPGYIPPDLQQTMFGGGARMMFNQTFGVEGGVIYEQYMGRMKPRLYIFPVIQFK